MLTERTDRAWFNCLLRHRARKWGGYILTTPEPAWSGRRRNEQGCHFSAENFAQFCGALFQIP